MEDADRLQRFFSYDLWANNQIASALMQEEEFDGRKKVIQFYAHIAGSQEHWYRRIKASNEQNIAIWPEYSIQEASNVLSSYSQKWMELIRNERNQIDEPVSYTNSSGVHYDTPLSDILHHLVIHGQHHRAQIAAILRETDIAPPVTDYITYVRSQS